MSKIGVVFLLLLSVDVSVKTNPVEAGSENMESAKTEYPKPGSKPVSMNHWKSTGDDVKWQQDCDFTGYDIEYRFMPMEQSHIELCSQACIDTSGCNAFRWNDGWCYLKNVVTTPLSKTQVDSGTCGFLPWEFDKYVNP